MFVFVHLFSREQPPQCVDQSEQDESPLEEPLWQFNQAMSAAGVVGFHWRGAADKPSASPHSPLPDPAGDPIAPLMKRLDADTKRRLLFYITKNNNLNTVLYLANLDRDGAFDAAKPVVPMWMNNDPKTLREHGGRLVTEMTNPVEARAFAIAEGFTMSKDRKQVAFRINAYAGIAINSVINSESGGVTAACKDIDESMWRVTRLHAHCTFGGLIPETHFIQIFGKRWDADARRWVWSATEVRPGDRR